MLKIQTHSLLNSITDPDILKLVTLGLTQLYSSFPTTMIIVESGESLSSIEEEVGFSILTNLFDDTTYIDPDFITSCEALKNHGGCYEMLFILGGGDDAFDIFIPKTGVDEALLSMCAQLPIKILCSFGGIIKGMVTINFYSCISIYQKPQERHSLRLI